MNNDNLEQQLTSLNTVDLTEKISGKFHAHLTVTVDGNEMERCRNFCRENRVKLTVVDLENLSGRSQRDVMLTAHFRDGLPGAVARIACRLNELQQLANRAGLNVTRVKLEHESLPTLPQFTERQYHEVHIKLKLPTDRFDTDYQRLLQLGKTLGFVPSRNPFQRDAESVTQFVNLRIYKGDQSTADLRVNAVLEQLESNAFSVVEVQRETVVFDTAQSIDQWWA